MCLFCVQKIKKYEVAYYNINNFIYFLLQFIILASCGYFVVKGQIAYSIFIVIESYIWRIDDVVESLSDFGVNYNKIKVSLTRIDEIINNKLYKDEKFEKKESSVFNPIDGGYSLVVSKFDGRQTLWT